MNIKTSKFTARPWLALFLCCGMTLPLLAQQRSTGGGGATGFGGGGGGSSRSSGSSASSSSLNAPDRPANGQMGSANFYVDPDTHEVFVTTDAATAASVSQVMSNLDRPKPQVLIKVIFLQVTYNNGYDVGVEGGVTKNVKGSTVLSANNLFGLGAGETGAFSGAGATPLNSLPGAGLYTLAGNDFQVTLRAIQQVGKTEILSRPIIMTRNNQQATVVVGQQVPLVTGVSYDTFGNEHSAITYENVGVILQVTPFITPDNMVEMILAPQISSVDATHATVISGGGGTNGGTNSSFTTPWIDITSANTVVVTPNGQTVAIGGMMQDNKTVTDTKIPLIGDIPGLGLLFHHKVSSVTKTELIIFLTPYIVRSPEDLVRMTIDEKSRAVLSPKAFPAQELHQYLSPQPAAPTFSSPHVR